MLESRVKRLKRHYFVVWLEKYCKAEKRRQISDSLAAFSTANFAKRFFTPWIELTRYRQLKKDSFFKMRAYHLYKKAFFGFKDNLYNSNGDRQRVRKIVLMRAARLIRTTFYDGLLAYRM